VVTTLRQTGSRRPGLSDIRQRTDERRPQLLFTSYSSLTNSSPETDLMPYTLCHPAAIIPFARQRLVLSALVVGSLSPDFLYFINLDPDALFGHTIAGVFLLCLPLGMLVLWIFHALLKWPLLSLFPQALQERLIEPARGFFFWPVIRQLLIASSILIGAFTHIFWDGFTHEDGWAVSRLQFLSYPVIDLGSQLIPVFMILQHSSTIIGGGLLLLWFLQWIKQAPREEVSKSFRRSARYKLFWGSLVLVGAAILGMLFSWWKIAQLSGERGLSTWLECYIFSAHSGLFIELVLFGIYWHFRGDLSVAGEGDFGLRKDKRGFCCK